MPGYREKNAALVAFNDPDVADLVDPKLVKINCINVAQTDRKSSEAEVVANLPSRPDNQQVMKNALKDQIKNPAKKKHWHQHTCWFTKGRIYSRNEQDVQSFLCLCSVPAVPSICTKLMRISEFGRYIEPRLVDRPQRPRTWNFRFKCPQWSSIGSEPFQCQKIVFSWLYLDTESRTDKSINHLNHENRITFIADDQWLVYAQTKVTDCGFADEYLTDIAVSVWTLHSSGCHYRTKRTDQYNSAAVSRRARFLKIGRNIFYKNNEQKVSG